MNPCLLKCAAGAAAMITAFTASMAPAHAEGSPDASYVRAGRLVDVQNGRVLDDQLIRVVNGRIDVVSVWAGAPADGPVLDWSGYTVLPGLMDMHTHLVGDIQSDIAGPLTASGADDALVGAANARKTLCAGFTTVRDVGSWRAFTDVALRNAIEKGYVEGPRMFVAGAYITIPNGGGAMTGFADDVGVPEEMQRGVVVGADEAKANTRDLLQHDVDLIKLIATGAVLTVGTEPGLPELSEEEMRAAVEEARKYGKYATAHAHGAEGAKMAIRAGVRSIEHGSLLDDEALRMMKKNGVWLVADIYNGDYIDEVGTRDGWPEETLRKNRETTDTQRDVFSRAVKMGVRIAYGTDAGVFPHGDNALQFPNMVKYGLTPMQAIQSATLWSAQLLDREGEIGAVASGRYADMIAVEGDPLADIAALSEVRGVLKGGEEVLSCKGK